MYKLPVFSAVVFIVLLLSCLVILDRSDQTFMDSFFPEVFGFSLEGLILFSGISMIQLTIAKQQKQDSIQNLKLSLRAVASGYVACCHLVAAEHGEDSSEYNLFDSSREALDDLHDRLGKTTISDNSDSVIELVEYVKLHKTSLDAALPIAAQLGAVATNAWFGFLADVWTISSSASNYEPAICNSLIWLKWINR